ncbi:MAG TPA: hypothetical protein VFE06_04700 [Acidobacteriaceae bacterium]|jgi:hypothetical protein|nr:hypothetical protein [Acidobacteriaceae bacterium]
MRSLLPNLALLAFLLPFSAHAQVRKSDKDFKIQFRTSDRCVACHNGLKTQEGHDISIGFDWSASIMANASRDPYWQGSVRRESIDHPESKADVEDECSTCHMPLSHFTAEAEGHKPQVFSHLPLSSILGKDGAAADGVSCSVCHQIEKTRLGTPQSFSGNVVFAGPSDPHSRPEYGPFDVDKGHQHVMQSSTHGMVPTLAAHIRDAALCGSCHTLYTKARGPGGKAIGTLPEQMPYLEWLHSDYKDRETCQQCHMPVVNQPVAITAVFGPLREGMHRHEFIGGNFLMQQILNDYRRDLATAAQPRELVAATLRTREFLQTQSAKVSVQDLTRHNGHLSLEVRVRNLTGHKLPTAYPSRRAWLHVTVQDRDGHTIFESGALNPDGSIAGNVNDEDPNRYEPHYPTITSPQQVEIFESILRDSRGAVTTGLLSAVGYLKDNRVLPTGFDKATASHDIAVTGRALEDPNFTGGSSTVRYLIDTGAAPGPFRVRAELWYQPIGYRWAHNLAPYQAAEPQRFVHIYESEAARSAVILATADAGEPD